MSTLALTPVVHCDSLWAAEPGQRYDIQIGATTVTEGLRALESRTGVSLAFSEKEIGNLRTAGVAGRLTVEEALNALVAGTGLTVRTNGKGTYVVSAPQKTSEAAGITRIADSTVDLRPQTAAASAAPAPAAQSSSVEEIVVTGTRIVREGYEAPTPLSVVDQSALENRPDPNLAVLIAEMPAFSGSGIAQTQSNGLSSSSSGSSNVNLRNLGIGRTLVLLDGQRTVGSAASGQGVDISSYPQQLISRVDIVTGGASAVYGSDAVAGVVNFILDKQFTGVKGDVSGGITNYGDGRNFSVRLSGGFGFADDRGHVLLSGEEELNGGTNGDGGRPWDLTGTQIMTNPNYTPTNGQPNQLVLNHVGLSNETLGGIVVSGPLKGLAFGPGGAPYQLNFGNLQAGTQFQGGDWFSTETRQREDIIQREHRQNLFARISYDVTDNVNAFAQSFWTDSRVEGHANLPYASSASTEPVIKVDNAFLPVSVKAAMIANKVTQFQIGTWNDDIGFEYVDNNRIVNQNMMGLNGNFDAGGTNWKWDAHGSYGIAYSSINYFNTYTLPNYALATDAVVNPTTGAIVCRIKLTDPNNPCQPWNPLGIGVNADNGAGRAYIIGDISHAHNKVEQGDFAGSVTGEPFSVPAGPVSVAVSAEHRIESVHNTPDPTAVAILHNQGNPAVINGKLSVTEGALETVVPIAKNLSWAENWDFNGAVRFTGYSQAGYVTTWKLGTTYSPIDDIRFRVTRSRDIRAPNVQELFLPQSFATGTVLDPFTGQRPTYRTITSGNLDLAPEKADTTGIGVVLTPRFLEGFTASVDYWDVDLTGGIATVAAADVINSCYSGTHAELCSDILRVNGSITQVNVQYQNVAEQDVRGIDVESSYRIKLADVFSSMDGDVTLHGNATFYLRNFQDNGIAPPSNHVGENNGGSGPPWWRMTVSATYQLNPITVQLTGRALSSGRVNSEYIECTSGCPASTSAHVTVDNNHLPGAFYLDANLQYAFDMGGVSSTAYLTVRNMFNKNPPAIPTAANYQPFALAAAGLYDIDGVVFRAGLRFKY